MDNNNNDSNNPNGLLDFKKNCHLMEVSLADNGINPNFSSDAKGSFSFKTRKQIIKNWMARKDATRIESVEYEGKFVKVKFVRDVVGLWTVDPKTKSTILPNIDCISSFDIEHIISNSYGADNDDVRNGVLLDSVINRKKGNTLLFLADESLLQFVRRKQLEQIKYFRMLKPWYKRYL